ncbi:MAG: hypothetical protein GYB64_09865 [Chloroflexi bacterium]|nr:hypothetical protein [Chloroflexota bacterium]
MLYLLDVLIALGIVITVSVLYGTKVMGQFTFSLFVLGCALGSVWEFGLHAAQALSAEPIFRHLTEWPLPTLLQPLLHSFWDGGLFLIGVGLVVWLLPAPHFEHFRPAELLVLLGWGVGSALLIEVIASAGAWEYIPRPWNPALFTVNGVTITALPLMIWFVASILFYIGALGLQTHQNRVQ